MRIAIITDQHFGARNDSPTFLNFFQNFYETIFFPKLIEEGITVLLILGDTFDRRKYVNFYSLKRTKEMFFDKLEAMGIEVHMLAGNHDTFYKNTNDVNSVDLLLREYTNITVYDTPQTIHLDFAETTHDICMIPWICVDNYAQCLEEIKNTSAQICMGHFEISGFQMHKGMPSDEGLERSMFRKFDMTFSGHYHHKSSADGIHYLGCPYQMTWQDYNDPKGFHILDLESRNLEFIGNPYEIFHRISYDDKVSTIQDITTADYSQYSEKYLKVVVVNKTNPFLFDMFVNKLYNVNPVDLQIVEEFTDTFEFEEGDLVNEAEDTLTILNKYVDGLTSENLDSNKLKSIMRDLYNDALNLENV